MPPQKRSATDDGLLGNNKFTSLSNWCEEYPELTSSPPRKRKRPASNNESFFESIDESIYVVVKCTDGNKKMSDLSVFGVQKAIESICGSDVKNTTVLRDGSLLIQTKNVLLY